MTASPSLDAFLATLPPDVPLGVAVSGGSDSMALLQMLAHAPCMVCASTVHHHLRPEAGDEAAFVAAFCARHNIAHETLHWHWDGQGNLQDQARRARYRLLGAWAERHGLDHVLLGHTADDNVETFLMGLSRGAGLDGLSGMRPSFTRGAVAFHRPLLDMRRADLRNMLAAQGVTWCDDPSNDDPKYQRIQLRQAISALDAAGLAPEMMLKSIANLRSTRRDVDAALVASARGHVTQRHGDLRISLDWFTTAPPEHRRRLLNAALRYVSSRDYPPRAAKLTPLLNGLAGSATLHGCVLVAHNGALHITREPAATPPPVPSTDIWDSRWRCDGPHLASTKLRALGEDGIAACPTGWRALGLPRASVLASPSVWDGDTLLSAPMADWANGWVISLRAIPPEPLASILSH